MDALEVVLAIAAAGTLGLMAGVFWLYAHAIMPGLGRRDDRTFVGAFQGIDGAIVNPMFMATFSERCSIKSAGDPDAIDVATVRAGFEPGWVRWNLIRTVLCVASFASSCWALVELGQTA